MLCLTKKLCHIFLSDRFLQRRILNSSTIQYLKGFKIRYLQSATIILFSIVSSFWAFGEESISNPKMNGIEEYLIVTRSLFLDSLSPLIQAKQNLGLEVQVITLSEIETSYPGEDVISKIRNCIRERYDEYNCRWVLLVGSPDADDNPAISTDLTPVEVDKNWELPVRYIYCPTDDYTYVPCEMYYSCLDGDWDADGDGVYGERHIDCGIGIDEVDWIPEVGLGRIPAETAIQVETYISKLLSVDYSSYTQSQLNTLQISCSIEDELADGTIPGLVLANVSGYDPPTINRIDTELNSGNYPLVTITGHGNEIAWSVADGLWTGDGLESGGSIFLCYAAACLTSYIDKYNTTQTIAEKLLFKPDCGAIGYIGAWRLSTPIGQNDLWREFWRSFFDGAFTRPGDTLNLAGRGFYFWQAYWHHNWYKYFHYTQLTYSLLGDPHQMIGQIPPNGPDIVSVPSFIAWDLHEYHYDENNTCEAIGNGNIFWEKISGPEYFNISEDGVVSWIPDVGNENGNNGRPTIVVRATDNNGATDHRWVVQCGNSSYFGEITSIPHCFGISGDTYYYDDDNTAETTGWTSVTWKLVEGPNGFSINSDTGFISWIPQFAGDYEIILQAAKFAGYSFDFQRFVVRVDMTDGVENVVLNYPDFGLNQNFPNPFNPVTTISYHVPSDNHVRLAIYDMSGRLVKVLVDHQAQESGRQEVVWEGTDNYGQFVGTGVYFYRLDTGGLTQTKRMTLIK